MIQLVEASFHKMLTQTEFSLLEVCRDIVCRSGIFETELDKAEVQFGDGLDNDDHVMNLNEDFMGTVIDKLGN